MATHRRVARLSSCSDHRKALKAHPFSLRFDRVGTGTRFSAAPVAVGAHALTHEHLLFSVVSTLWTSCANKTTMYWIIPPQHSLRRSPSHSRNSVAHSTASSVMTTLWPLRHCREDFGGNQLSRMLVGIGGVGVDRVRINHSPSVRPVSCHHEHLPGFFKLN